jgi:hypothetical protein
MALIKEKTPKKEPQSDNATDKIASILELFKGEPGKEGEKGKDGLSASPQEVARELEKNNSFIERIKGEKGEDGKDGNDGEDGRDGKDGLDGRDGRDGKDGRDGVDGKDGSPDTAQDIIKKISGKLTIDDIKDLERFLNTRIPSQMIGAPRIPTFTDGLRNPTPFGSFNVNLGASGALFYANQGTQDYTLDLSNITGGGGGSGVTVTIPLGDVNGINQTYTVTGTPKWIVGDGITYFPGAGYSIVGTTVTMDLAPTSYIRAII